MQLELEMLHGYSIEGNVQSEPVDGRYWQWQAWIEMGIQQWAHQLYVGAQFKMILVADWVFSLFWIYYAPFVWETVARGTQKWYDNARLSNSYKNAHATV